MTGKPTIDAREQNLQLVVENVAFQYTAGPLIGSMTFQLGPGLHWLDGINGAGKSTILRCLSGDLQPIRGHVTACGRDPVNDVSARVLIGHAPYPDDLPTFLNIEQALADIAAFRRCPEWRGNALAERLSLPLDLPLAHASAGQRRKAGLLASLVGDPPILLLDEPWAAIDHAAIDVVTSLLESLRATRIVLFTCHGECPLEPDTTHRLEASGASSDGQRGTLRDE